jgi:hypothetical protein
MTGNVREADFGRIDSLARFDTSPRPVIREIAPDIKAIRGEGRPSKRLRRELERMWRAGPS